MSDEVIVILAGFALVAFIVWVNRDAPTDAGFSSSPNSDTWTVSAPAEQRNGFTRALHVYQRGPGDPPGNCYVWHCDECDRFIEQGHADTCSRRAPEGE